MADPQHILDRLGCRIPVLQAPMAGSQGSALAIAVGEAGGLGALPCAMLSAEQVRAEVAAIRAATAAPFNLNFFCHPAPMRDPARDAAWRAALKPHYEAAGLDPDMAWPAATRQPFDDIQCALVEDLRPAVVSFHFGLPAASLLTRVKATGAAVLSSATNVAEARFLAEAGCDAIIAQGADAGGHRGMFLATRPEAQIGTMALVPQIVDAVDVPVIAAGGIADGRGVAAALMLGASAVQVGTAYLVTPEAATSAVHRAALAEAGEMETALTNVFTGRPARGLINQAVASLGPISAAAPSFPLAAAGISPLRAAAEKAESGDFSPLWAGQAAGLAKVRPAGELTSALWNEARALLRT